ncbi:MAG: hypothetical protein MRK02_03310 [Candidatus Scalindua sp.]|nr:hypothetical protein [Candidatus Scalindua sp.]
MPFYPRLNGRTFKTLQIPTNQPCIEELIGPDFVNNDNLVEYQISRLHIGIPNVVTIHAEVEVEYIEKNLINSLRKRFPWATNTFH